MFDTLMDITERLDFNFNKLESGSVITKIEVDRLDFIEFCNELMDSFFLYEQYLSNTITLIVWLDFDYDSENTIVDINISNVRMHKSSINNSYVPPALNRISERYFSSNYSNQDYINIIEDNYTNWF